jgi:transcriptional regulator with XRE-family HTH domain
MTTSTEGAPGVRSDVELIRRQLEALGLSQREAARQLGVDDRSMRYFCSGKLPVPPTVFLALEQLAEIQKNDQSLAMLEDGTMSTSDGEQSTTRLREANSSRRAAIEVHMQHLRAPPDPPVLPTPDKLEEAYEAADDSGQPLDEIGLAGKLQQVLTDLGRELAPGERRGVFAVVGGLYFQSRRSYGDPVWEMHWQPLSTMIDRNGTAHHSPSVKLSGDDTIQEWSRRGRTAQHPVLRARYADLAWEIAKYRIVAARQDNPAAPKPARPNADDARRAIDAYLEAVDHKLTQDVFDAWRYLGRAVELAATIRDSARLNCAKDALFNYRAAGEAEKADYPFWLFDEIAWEHRDSLALTEEEKVTVVRSLERALALRSDICNPSLFEPYIAQDAADRLARWRTQVGAQIDAPHAASIAGRAFEAAAAQAKGLTAIALLERQAFRYRKAGDKESAARVEQAIRQHAPEAQGELKRIESRYEIPKEELDSWADHVAGATFQEGLSRVVAANLIRKGQSETSVRELAKEAVLYAHVNISVMRADGFSGAEIGSVEKDLDGRVIHHAANAFGYSAPFLNVALARFRDKHNVDLDRLMSVFEDAPLFPSGRRQLVREGLAAWFAEDWIKSIHILLPQAEATLRDLLSQFGAPVMKPDRHYGGFQAIGLGEVLSHDSFRDRVPEDMRFHLRVLLQDPRGINLRNEFAHGLAARELFDRGIANWTVHLILMLGLIRLEGSTGSPTR